MADRRFGGTGQVVEWFWRGDPDHWDDDGRHDDHQAGADFNQLHEDHRAGAD
jgi:hypothetical protein